MIGRICRDVPAEQATDVIHGYTIGNDVTARDLQKSDVQFTRAKGFDSFCPLGPWIETDLDPQDFTDGVASRPTSTATSCRTAPPHDMIFDIPTLIAYVSSVMTLLPGDVILTGTPEGVGPMEVGDEVEVSVAGLGALTNKVVTAVSASRPRPDGAQPDRQPARRPGPHGALQLGVRAPPRRHVRVPDRGHRQGAQHPGVLRRAARPDALARPRLGRGPARSAAPHGRTGSPSAATSTPTSLAAAARVEVHLRLLLHHRGGRRAPQGVRLQGDGVRRLLPRAHRRAGRGVRGRGPRAGRPVPDARRLDHLGRPGPRRRSPSRPSSCPTSRCAAPTATRSTRWSTRSTTR